MDGRHLSQLLDDAARGRPDHPAVEDEHGRRLSYAALRHGADRLATRLARWGVGRGDRVGVFLPKSLEAVTAIHGVLRLGAAYVPVDPSGPIVRAVNILGKSGVKAAIIASDLAPALRAAWQDFGPVPRLVCVDGHSAQPSATPGESAARAGTTAPIEPNDAAWPEVMADRAPAPLLPSRAPGDLAYVLFTSGSTGRPKGVMLSHANAFNFLDWCDLDLGPWRADDRFSSHAPFHFDLSVFDLFASCRSAATLVLIGEALGKDPVGLGDFLESKRISVWYSSPSILSMLASHGRLDRRRFDPPRLVLFAGEVFPIEPLRRLRAMWPHATMWNLYGPTETNVCTAYRIPAAIPEDQTSPFPIGRACEPLLARVVDESSCEVPAGQLGELIVAGPGVMRGYFGQPELSEAAFVVDQVGTRWYRTGDLVRDLGDGVLQFHGRRDRMVKKRGYRIELGEIEEALYRHDGVDRAGVVARTGEEGLSIMAFVALKPNEKASIIAMKRHCTKFLPHYMIPDTVTFLDQLPETSTDKVDYQSLKALVEKEGPRL
jgi:amino acid adenylation domain-containing protein